MPKLPLLSFFFAVLLGTASIRGETPKSGEFKSRDGIKIHYLELGTSGTPVILIHGSAGSASNWVENGVAEALAKKHRVIAIDCRGHGESDKPLDPEKYGPHLWQDVIDLMDHLKIEKGHVHGYSMGEFITCQLLAYHPDRLITAAFGGSGIPEVEPREQMVTPKDKVGADPREAEVREKLEKAPGRNDEVLKAMRDGGMRVKGDVYKEIDLTKVTIPVFAIIGEFDTPNRFTHRMARELRSFSFVVLPGKSHLTAITAGAIPPKYIESLVGFIDKNDPK